MIQVVAFAEEYRWWPPPWFTILLTVSQIIIFVIVEKSIVNQGADNPNCSYFIYSPYRRLEIWRFLTYMFIHVDLEHLLMNTGMLIMVSENKDSIRSVYIFTQKVLIFIIISNHQISKSNLGGITLRNEPWKYKSYASVSLWSGIRHSEPKSIIPFRNSAF